MEFQWDNIHQKRDLLKLVNLLRVLHALFLFHSASGSYCVKDTRVPFCPANENDVGDKRCCLDSLEWGNLLQ